MSIKHYSRTSPRTVQAPAAPRSAIPRPRPRTVPMSYVVAAALVGGGVAWATGQRTMTLVVAVLAVGALVGASRHNARAARNAALQQMIATAAVTAWGWAVPDPSRIQLRRWSQGRPTWIRLRYPRASAAISDEVAALIAPAVSASLGLVVEVVGARRGQVLTLAVVDHDEEAPLSAEDQRVQDVIMDLMGECTPRITRDRRSGTLSRIEVHHSVPVKAAGGMWRGRVERTLSTVLEGRWRATWNLQRDTVTFELRPDLPDAVPHPYTEVDDANINKIPFGVDEDGNTTVWDLKGPGPHCLVVGKTGTGKTVTINGIVLEWIRRGWQAYICDPKRIEFLGARSWPNVRYVATLVPDMVVMIHQAHEEMERRYAAIERGADESDFEPYLLVLDEYRNFVRLVTAWYAATKVRGMPSKCPIFDEVAALAEKGRSARVHIIMGTQRPDAEYLGGGMRDNFDTRISNGRLSPQGAVMMWDSPHLGVAVPRGKRGRGTAITSAERVSEVQMYWTPDPRRAERDRKPEDLAILNALLPPKSAHSKVEIDWPVRLEDEDWSQDDPLTWTDCVDARLVDTGTAQGRTVTVPSSPASETEPLEDPHPGGVDLLEDVDADYGPMMHVAVTKVRVGDLVMIDDDTGQWATVSEIEVDEDVQSVDLEWRDDDDESGGLTLDDSTILTVRRPYDLQGDNE